MTKKYLGKTPIKNLEGTPYEGNDKVDWALYWVGSYGQIDGEHHKLWVLDQVARILNGTKVNVFLAKWDNGFEEYRHSLGEPSQEYLDWVTWMRGDDGDGGDEYSYNEGSCP